MAITTEDHRRVGRPRDERIDDAVLNATVAVLEESGFAGATIAAISRRSGVPAPTIYRRWANRVEMIEAAVFPPREVAVPVPTGDLKRDLQAYLDAIAAPLDRPAARAALPGLLAEYLSDPERYRGITFRVGLPIRDAFHELLRGEPPGAIDPAIDPDSVLDLMAASVVYARFIRPFTGRGEPATPTVDIVVKALTSADHGSARSARSSNPRRSPKQ